MIVSFVVQKLLSLIRSHLSVLAFVAIAFGVMMKSLPVLMSRMLLPMLSSKLFRVLGFILRLLVHLELIFVCNIRKGSSSNLLHMASYPSTIY